MIMELGLGVGINMFSYHEFKNILNLAIHHKNNCNDENCRVMLFEIRLILEKIADNLPLEFRPRAYKDISDNHKILS